MGVDAVLVRGEAARSGAGKAGAVRVTSRELNYSDEARRAEFSGGVQVDSADGRMRGQQAVVNLQAAAAGSGKPVAAGKTAGAGGGFGGGGGAGGGAGRSRGGDPPRAGTVAPTSHTPSHRLLFPSASAL